MTERGGWVRCPRCEAESAVFVPSEDAIEGCPECEADEWTDAELETLRTLAMGLRVRSAPTVGPARVAYHPYTWDRDRERAAAKTEFSPWGLR